MMKRPLNPRFSSAVLEGRKFTTIREKPWPVGVPIMLYNWSGAAYRSPQVDVAPVVVMGFWTIQIAQMEDGIMRYAYGMQNNNPLWQTEGFDSAAELDAWFRTLVKPGATVTKHLMRFRLANRSEEKWRDVPSHLKASESSRRAYDAWASGISLAAY
jgi:hypothetical protein